MKSASTNFELDGVGPLYRQIKRAISEPILSGRIEPGVRLPSEHAFMAMFETSRMTVNRALQMLADEGLVVRHRRNGTFVAPQVAEHAMLELRDIGEEIDSTGAAYGFSILKQETLKLPSAVAARLGVRSGSNALHLQCLHFADRAPFVLEDRYIHLRAVPAAPDVDFTHVPPSRWLLENVPWSRAKHAILAVNAPEAIAKLLGIELGAACLQVERTTWLAELPVTFVTLTYSGSGHRLTGSFTPGR